MWPPFPQLITFEIGVRFHTCRVRSRMLDRVAGMQVFVRVAALGGFSAAARELAMSPTMVPKHIDAIESRLGFKLVHRTTRRLTLTEAGRSYLEAAERI